MQATAPWLGFFLGLLVHSFCNFFLCRFFLLFGLFHGCKYWDTIAFFKSYVSLLDIGLLASTYAAALLTNSTFCLAFNVRNIYSLDRYIKLCSYGAGYSMLVNGSWNIKYIYSSLAHSIGFLTHT